MGEGIPTKQRKTHHIREYQLEYLSKDYDMKKIIIFFHSSSTTRLITISFPIMGIYFISYFFFSIRIGIYMMIWMEN
jgi:hypothetical protein